MAIYIFIDKIFDVIVTAVVFFAEMLKNIRSLVLELGLGELYETCCEIVKSP